MAVECVAFFGCSLFVADVSFGVGLLRTKFDVASTVIRGKILLIVAGVGFLSPALQTCVSG